MPGESEEVGFKSISMRVNRCDDLAVLLMRTEREDEAACLRDLPEDISGGRLEARRSYADTKGLDSLRAFVASLREDAPADSDVRTGHTHHGRGASGGAELFMLGAAVLSVPQAVEYFYKKIKQIRGYIKSQKRPSCILSKPALKLFIGEWLKEIFPDDFEKDKSVDVELTCTTGHVDDRDPFFAYTDQYHFIAYGKGVSFGGKVDASGGLINGEVTITRHQVKVETISAHTPE